MNRREFLFSTAAFSGLAGCVSIKMAKKKDSGRILIGACRPNADAALMKSIGYDFIEGQVAACFVPDKGEEEWKRRRDAGASEALPYCGLWYAQFRGRKSRDGLSSETLLRDAQVNRLHGWRQLRTRQGRLGEPEDLAKNLETTLKTLKSLV